MDPPPGTSEPLPMERIDSPGEPLPHRAAAGRAAVGGLKRLSVLRSMSTSWWLEGSGSGAIQISCSKGSSGATRTVRDTGSIFMSSDSIDG